MDERVVFYLFFVFLETIAAVSLTEETFNITEDIHMRCPYSDTCNRNATLQISDTIHTPCCKSCSCAPDCGLHMNCCYEHLDTYRLIESLQLVCVNTGDDDLFYMVDTCLNDLTGINQCREKEVEFEMIDNLAPVSSMDTHAIYFNAECAKCNGVHVYTSWNYKLDCADGIANTVQPRLKEDSNCSSIYLPPNSESWEARQCYTFENVTCEDEYVWLTEACQSLKAPYIKERLRTELVYENIYCAMCSGIQPERDICLSEESRSSSNTFSTIINGAISSDLMKSLLQEYPTHIDQTDEQCLYNEVNDPYKNECRHLYCPDGMIRIDNECAYFTAWWIVSHYIVQIELRPYPGTQLKTSSMESLRKRARKYPTQWMHSICMDDKWTSVEVFSKLNDHNNTETHIVKSLIVRLFMLTVNTNGFDPTVVIPHLDECIRGRWLLTIDGQEYPFRADLYKYRRYVQDGNAIRYNSIQGTIDVQPQLYESIAKGPQDMTELMLKFDNTDGVEITKLCFCQQVRLDLSEVDVGYGEIRMLSHDVVVGDNEYEIYHVISSSAWGFQRNDNLTTISVCLEDFDHDAWRQLQPQTSDCDNNSRDSLVYVTVVVIPVLFSFLY